MKYAHQMPVVSTGKCLTVRVRH